MVNLDDSSGDGTRWCCWFKCTDIKYYFGIFKLQPLLYYKCWRAEDVATRNYDRSLLVRKKLGSWTLLLTRTADLKVELSDTAGPTLKLVFSVTFTNIVAGVDSTRSTTESTHIVGVNDEGNPRNRRVP